MQQETKERTTVASAERYRIHVCSTHMHYAYVDRWTKKCIAAIGCITACTSKVCPLESPWFFRVGQRRPEVPSKLPNCKPCMGHKDSQMTAQFWRKLVTFSAAPSRPRWPCASPSDPPLTAAAASPARPRDPKPGCPRWWSPRAATRAHKSHLGTNRNHRRTLRVWRKGQSCTHLRSDGARPWCLEKRWVGLKWARIK